MGVVIPRDPAKLAATDYDVVVVGGGVYGIALTLEAARRGVSVALVERDDFGGATSWNSLRIVHGGLRYLQSADLHRFRESVTERRRWLIEFPDQVQPLPCLMPLYGRGLRRPVVLRAALTGNDWLSRRRNDGVRPDRVIPDGKILNTADTVSWFDAVVRDRLVGGALWHDAIMIDSQRLIVEMLHWATAAGADVLNQAEATSLEVGNGAVRGLTAVDRLDESPIRIRAPMVVNCAGPWARDVASRLDRDVPELFRYSIAFNALLDRPPLSEAALAVEPRSGGRTYFLVPWKERILAGTFHAPCHEDSPPTGVPDALVERFLSELNDAVPDLAVRREDVLRLHHGVLPARSRGTDGLAVREQIHDHGPAGGPDGLVSVSGVKFTTARLVAEKTLAPILGVREADIPSPVDSPRPTPTGVPDRAAFDAMLASDPDRARTTVEAMARTESVTAADDILMRRTDWGSDPRDAERLRPVIEQFLP